MKAHFACVRGRETFVYSCSVCTRKRTTGRSDGESGVDMDVASRATLSESGLGKGGAIFV